jgi:predicted Zn-dependent peptidase
MRALGSQWTYTGEYRSLEQDMATLRSLTAAKLKDLMRKYPFDPMTVVSLGP